MTTTLGISIAALILLTGVAYLIRSRRLASRTSAPFAQFARQHELELKSSKGAPRVEGTYKGKTVLIEMRTVQLTGLAEHGEREAALESKEVFFSTPFESAHRLLVARPFLRGAIDKPLDETKDAHVGDPAFRRTFRVTISSGAPIGWLDAGTRKALLKFAVRELRLDDGELSVSVRTPVISDKLLGRALRLLLRVAGRL